MRIEFKGNSVGETLLIVFVFAALLGMFILPFLPVYIIVGAVAVFAVLAGVTIFLMSLRGVLNAEEKGIFIASFFLGNKVSEKFIEYGDIDSVKCVLHQYRSRSGGSSYALDFTMKMKNGKTFSTTENVESVWGPRVRSDDRVIAQQPLQKLYEYINERL